MRIFGESFEISKASGLRPRTPIGLRRLDCFITPAYR